MRRPPHARLRLAAVNGAVISSGYKSGRSSLRETPDSSSSVSTRSGGTPLRRHLSTACGEIRSDLASFPRPHALIALSTAGLDMPLSQPQVERRVNLRLLVNLNPSLHPDGMSSLGKIIVRELERLGNTQAWLAEKVGVSENAVSKWIITGKIGRANAIKAAPYLGVSLDQLLKPDPQSDPDAEWQTYSPLLKAQVIAMVHGIRGAAIAPEQSQKTRKKR